MRIADAHNDIFTSGKNQQKIKKYFEKIAQNSPVRLLTGVLWTKDIQCGGAHTLRLLDPFKGLKTAIEIVFAVENLNFMFNESAKILADYQIKYASLTWNFDNNLGGGAMEDGGLTEHGRRMIKSLKAHEIAFDTAHLNQRTFDEALDLEHYKIMCSHTNMYAVNAHRRNLTDRQIGQIVDRGGFVGISLVTPFLTDKDSATSLDVVRHIDHFVQKFGTKNVGLGTDFFGTEDLPLDIGCYKDLNTVAIKLSALGYSQVDIDNIFYANYKKFLFS